MSFPPDLDIRLIFRLSAVLGLAVGLLFLVLARVEPRARSLRPWALGVMGLGLGNAGYALRGLAPDFVSIVLAHTLILASLLALHAGTIRLCSGTATRRADIAGWSVVGTSFLLLLWLTHAAPDLGRRVLVVCVATAILMARTAWSLSAFAQGRGSSFPANVLAGLWWLLVAIVLVTALATVAHGERSQDIFQAGPQLMTLFHVRPVLLLFIAAFSLWTQFHVLRIERRNYLSCKRARIRENQAAFRRVCDRAIAEGRRPLSVAIIDMDDFQQLARRHGLAAAEAVLEWVAQIVSSQLKATDILGVHGNDQFAVLLPGIDRQAALTLMEEVRRRVQRARCLHEDKTLTTTVSIGLAAWEPRRATTQAMTAAAKVALYRARAQGRNRVAVAPEAGADLNLESGAAGIGRA